MYGTNRSARNETRHSAKGLQTDAVADMSDYARFNEIYREYFKAEPLPTRSTVAVKELARGARIEITMMAVRTK